MGLNMILVNGTDHNTLKKGPGRDERTFMPGENRLVYIAGHRTTYLAPFSHIDDIHKVDAVTIEVPYGTFTYRISGHRVVAADDVSVLRSPRHERLILQACHPRFFASHRYLQYGQLLRVEPKGGAPYELSAAAAQAGESRR
jgi:sortase A